MHRFGCRIFVNFAKYHRPILMTTLAASLALMPIALGGNKPGHEIEFPMAIVILGRLTTSIKLNLFILPLVYWQFGKKKSKKNTELKEV